MGQLLVVGSVNADLVVHVDRRPHPGETVRGGDLVVSPGGKGANQAVAAALLGAEVTLVGAVGQDQNAEVALRDLVGAGVGVDQVRHEPGSTGTAVIVVTPDGENTIVVSPGANGTVTPERAADAVAAAPEGAVVLLQLELPLATVRSAAAAARDRGLRLVVNAAPAAPPDREILLGCDPLVVNESEAASLLGQPGDDIDAEAAAAALLALGARSVIVTLGARGCLVATPDGDRRHLPAPRVEAVDTTGAGDAFVGALTAALADGVPLPHAARRAVVVGAMAVQRPGAQPSYPTAADVAEFARRG